MPALWLQGTKYSKREITHRFSNYLAIQIYSQLKRKSTLSDELNLCLVKVVEFFVVICPAYYMKTFLDLRHFLKRNATFAQDYYCV